MITNPDILSRASFVPQLTLTDSHKSAIAVKFDYFSTTKNTRENIQNDNRKHLSLNNLIHLHILTIKIYKTVFFWPYYGLGLRVIFKLELMDTEIMIVFKMLAH